MQATTYKLIDDYGAPGVGMTLTDVWYNEERGRIAYVNLQRAGDSIDLLKVDIQALCRSATHGLIHDLLMNKGLLTVVRQEVPEAIANRLQQEMSFQKNPVDDRPVLTEIFMPEPGMQIARSKVPEPPHALPVPPVEEPAAEDQAAVAPVAGQSVDGQPAEPVEQQTEASPEAPEGQAEWKTDRDYETQKSMIVNSEDPEFLKAVAADQQETAQFKKLARYRLNQLLVEQEDRR